MTAQSIRPASFALLLVLLLTPVLPAQETGEEPRSGWELSPFIGGYDDGPEFGPADESRFVDPERNPLFGARLGYTLPSGFFLEGTAETVSLLFNDAPGTAANQARDLDLWMYSALAGYRLRLHRRLELSAGAGAGASRWSPDGLDSETDFTLSYGAGARVFLTESLALRGDVRLYQTPEALTETRSRAGAPASDETFWGWASTGGISFFFGGRSDSDGDGVRDERDACPDTPEGVEVDAAGCPVDSDGDGVADHRDDCPATPAGARVDERGCAVDGDGDGVADGIDECPATPAGARVDERGCAGDDDEDGVVNGVDECPATPAGARVDERGCVLDGDGDGVPDGLDDCPDTAPGTEVDEAGCPLEEAQRDLEEEGRFSVEAVHFDFGSAELRASADSVLGEVGRALARNPDMEIRIEGHTDSIGGASYNDSLSLRRARAVRDHLVQSFDEIVPDRFEVQGFGESRPVADNATEEGRRRNRRVEFVVIGREGM